jgi:hypothetical protein
MTILGVRVRCLAFPAASIGGNWLFRQIQPMIADAIAQAADKKPCRQRRPSSGVEQKGPARAGLLQANVSAEAWILIYSS